MKRSKESETNKKDFEYALNYENIIRKANNNCNRFDIPAANADIYRSLIDSYGHLISCQNKKVNIEDAENKFYENCKLVSDNLHEAVLKLNEGNNNFSETITKFPLTTVDGVNKIIGEIIGLINEMNNKNKI